jgi:tetratricopeptide (TPR) repeat protein
MIKKFSTALGKSYLPTFVPSIRPSKRPIELRNNQAPLFTSGVEALHDAFRKVDVRLAWKIYNQCIKTREIHLLGPEDHTVLLKMLTTHTHPPIAAAHAARIVYYMSKCGIQKDPRDYHSLLLIHLNNRDLRRLLQCYESFLKDFPPDVRSTSIVLAAYATYQDTKGVLDTWNLLKNIPGSLDNPDVWALGIHSLGTSGNFEMAQSLFEKSKEKVLIQDLKPAEAMIRVYGSMGQLDSAVCLFDELSQKSSRLQLETFDAIIDACGRCNSSDLAIKYWNQTLEYCKQQREDRRLQSKIYPLACTFTRMIGIYSHLKDLDTVFMLYDVMRERYLPDAKAMEHIVWACLWAKNEKEAVEWYDAMVERGYMPSVLLVNTILHIKEKL